MGAGLDRWRSWNAAKLPGRAVNRFVRGWSSPRLTIEVHRTACIMTHPPGGETANDALVNPANERLAGTRFTPEECWRNLYGDPLTGRWDKVGPAALTTSVRTPGITTTSLTGVRNISVPVHRRPCDRVWRR